MLVCYSFNPLVYPYLTPFTLINLFYPQNLPFQFRGKTQPWIRSTRTFETSSFLLNRRVGTNQSVTDRPEASFEKQLC